MSNQDIAYALATLKGAFSGLAQGIAILDRLNTGTPAADTPRPAWETLTGLARLNALKAACKAKGLPCTGKAPELEARVSGTVAPAPALADKPARKPRKAKATPAPAPAPAPASDVKRPSADGVGRETAFPAGFLLKKIDRSGLKEGDAFAYTGKHGQSDWKVTAVTADTITARRVA